MTDRVTDRVRQRRRTRRRARRLVDVLTVTCAGVALAIGAIQIADQGLAQFLYRPPGVGASPSAPASRAGADTAVPQPKTSAAR